MTTKSDIIDAVASKTGQTKADAASTVDATFAAIADALAGGTKVTVLGFGVFNVKERAARKGRNPATGAVLDIPASKNVKFKAGKPLEERL